MLKTAGEAVMISGRSARALLKGLRSSSRILMVSSTTASRLPQEVSAKNQSTPEASGADLREAVNKHSS